jgi:hypothetical protein
MRSSESESEREEGFLSGSLKMTVLFLSVSESVSGCYPPHHQYQGSEP